MQFDEQKAAELIAKHQLSPNTLKVWSHRGTIPDKYLDEHFEVRKKVTDQQQQQQQRNVLRGLQTEKFVLKALSLMAGLKPFVLADFKKETCQLSVQELLAVKKAINAIRNEVKNLLPELNKRLLPEVAKKKLMQFILREEISFYYLLERDRATYNALYNWAIGHTKTFPDQHLDRLKGALLIFLTETAIS